MNKTTKMVLQALGYIISLILGAAGGSTSPGLPSVSPATMSG